jgi:hypothetical protein
MTAVQVPDSLSSEQAHTFEPEAGLCDFLGGSLSNEIVESTSSN